MQISAGFTIFIPRALLAIYMSCAVDFFATEHYILWDYPQGTKMQTYFYHLLQQLGVYPVVTYLYLQTLPKNNHRKWRVVRHIFYWSILALSIEWLALNTGYIKIRKMVEYKLFLCG
ncbi:CBO0543 family protein [Ammoniphilus sp. 3BR4]|uniref:CBO0543 family protein n=1 Tax=Ammoniphilus sp. 3BR4 TaxID=3158265 RepID=UPI003466F59F